MSNPTNGVWQFADDLDGQDQSGVVSFVGVDPIRFDGGLWLEEGTTNEIYNPSAVTNTGWWTTFAGTIARITDDGVTTGTCFEVTRDDPGGSHQFFTEYRFAISEGAPLAVQSQIKSGDGLLVRIVIDWYTAGDGYISSAEEELIGTGDWAELVFVATAPATTAKAQVVVRGFASDGGESADDSAFRVTDIQAEVNPYATSFTIGSAGAGYAHTGTPSESPSTRAASSASISPSGIFDTYLGAIVFRATPTVETGAEEIWGELGEKGAGTDHIRWGRDATKHPYVEWSGNDSAYTRITLTPTVDAGDEHFYSIEWHVGDADFRLYLDDNPSDNDTIPSPQEDYGAGTLKLEATAGGVIYNGLMICNARLTDAQRARLQEVDHWSVRTLERLRVGVARPQFELRPY